MSKDCGKQNSVSKIVLLWNFSSIADGDRKTNIVSSNFKGHVLHYFNRKEARIGYINSNE